jgi:hypothetical protein
MDRAPRRRPDRKIRTEALRRLLVVHRPVALAFAKRISRVPTVFDGFSIGALPSHGYLRRDEAGGWSEADISDP